MRLFVVFLVLFLAACENKVPQPVDKTRELVILTRVGITTYTHDQPGDTAGFEHDLVQRFAFDLGLRSRFVVAGSDKEVREGLERGEAHLAIAWTAAENELGTHHSQAYAQSRDVIVTHEASLPITQLKQLAGRTVHVVAGSRQEAALRDAGKRVRRLTVVPVEQVTELELMSSVAEQRFDIALVSDAAYDIGSNFYPVLQDSLQLGPDHPIVWTYAKDVPPDFVARADDFLRRMEASGELDRLKDRYFGHVNRLTTDDTGIFIERMRSTLPLYRPFFQEAQIRTGIDWRLLAALAYQESRWDPLATSATGVRGMMMLTAETADHLRVGNRLNAAQSIRAGAQYLDELRDALPASVREPDRTWLALAAYNLGMGHLNGARHLARTLGKDPDAWYEMKQVLPLLAKPQYYRRLKSGKGRGGEAVIMTENIRVFADILKRFEPPYEPMKRKSEKFIWKSFQAPQDRDEAPEAR